MPFPQNMEFAPKSRGNSKSRGSNTRHNSHNRRKLKVGLTSEELDLMCKGEGVGKVSRRDVAVYLATGKTRSNNSCHNNDDCGNGRD